MQRVPPMNSIAKNVIERGFDAVESVLPGAKCEHYVKAFEKLLAERYA